MATASKQCFRCGCDVIPGVKAGEITIAGYYDHNHPPYYNQFVLCDLCHIRLHGEIMRCLLSVEEKKNGNGNHA